MELQISLMFCIVVACLIVAQASSKEDLFTLSSCHPENTTVDCGNDAILVLESFKYVYNVTCSTQCCDTSKPGAENNQQLYLKDSIIYCRDQSPCTLPIPKQSVYFDSFNYIEPSYIVVKYYCIPKSRTIRIDETDLANATNSIVYLTNAEYPGVTTGIQTHTCSLEVESCSSNIRMFVADVDFYWNETCEQSVEVTDGTGKLIETVGCKNYYDIQTELHTLPTNYVIFNYTSKTDNNLQGQFLIGFEASESDAQFILKCPYQEQTVCKDCETPSIANGNVTLNSNTSFGATANVTCDPGYQTDTAVITCRINGLWDNAACSQIVCLSDEWQCKDWSCINVPHKCDNSPECPDGSDESIETCQQNCGPVYNITNGEAVLDDQSNTKTGATASVSCDDGYKTANYSISCLQDGLWENTTCDLVDCGQLPSMVNGMINLNDAGSTTFKSSANVTCTSGYDASTNTITCLDTGQWLEANCTIKDCGTVYNITNGKSQLNEANNTKTGASASVSCNPGYRTTTPNIFCEIDGLWQNATCDPVVDGGWSSWSTWNMCSEKCGSGLQSRNRTCDNPIPRNGGEICNGNSTEQHICYKADCLDIGPVTVPKTDYTLLIIILVCCAAFVWIVQLTSVACLVRREHSQHLKTTGKGKALIASGCFPVLGIPILIYISCSLKNRKYYVEQDYGSWTASTNTPYTIEAMNRSYPSFSSLYEETEIELPKEYTSANVNNNTTNLNTNSTSQNNYDDNTRKRNDENNIQYTHKKHHHKKDLKYRERASKHPDEHKKQSKGNLGAVAFSFRGFDKDKGPSGNI